MFPRGGTKLLGLRSLDLFYGGAILWGFQRRGYELLRPFVPREARTSGGATVVPTRRLTGNPRPGRPFRRDSPVRERRRIKRGAFDSASLMSHTPRPPTGRRSGASLSRAFPDGIPVTRQTNARRRRGAYFPSPLPPRPSLDVCYRKLSSGLLPGAIKTTNKISRPEDFGEREASTTYAGPKHRSRKVFGRE